MKLAALPPLAHLSRLAAQLGTSAPWRALQRRFDQLAPRERALVIAAAAVGTLLVADSLWLGPALAQHKAGQRERTEAHNRLADLQAETRKLEDSAAALARQQKAELAEWRQRVTDGDTQLRAQEANLVGPDRMLELLEQWLSRDSQVRVRALHSLGRSDLLEPPSNARSPATMASAATSKAQRPGPADPGLPTLYRHGVELVLEGGFLDLLHTLRTLENLPQHVLWGSINLQVEQHPKSVLKLRVYTVSRDQHWLEL